MKKALKVKDTLDQRKKDHIVMALTSRVTLAQADGRFYYEPLLKSHPTSLTESPFLYGGKTLKHPIWVSSMTGGTAEAGVINKRLGQVCKEFGLGMGLGSCRIILDDNRYFKDFDIRKFTGDDVPLFANLGIAQVEQIHKADAWDKIDRLIKKLQADGLIIHINPLQEWLQPEGDPITQPPIATIKAALGQLKMPIIVKEVGQGMGPESLKALMKMPLEAIEFAALGGTNFSSLELQRQDGPRKNELENISRLGHSALDMVGFVNAIGSKPGQAIRCKKFIISGGITDFLDGYYLMHKINYPSIYGQASSFLSPARESYEALRSYVKTQIEGLTIAYNYLTVRND